jgi:hypothetical protein
MLFRLLPAALLIGGLSAQVLVHDAGTFETSLVGAATKFSTLQNTTLAHTTYGYGAQKTLPTIDNSVYDDFEVCTPMLVDEVELYAYQTGSTTTSTITGMYIAFYDLDPNGNPPMLGSPTLVNDQFAWLGNPVANTFSGVYRDLETPPGATNRPIMRIRVRICDDNGNPTTMTFLPGTTYWIGRQFSGSLASGPWAPPLCSDNQPVTGNAKQRVTTGTWTDPVLSGVDPQGFPHKFYGPPTSLPGSFTLVASNSCGLDITVGGSANISDKGYIRTNLYNVTPGAVPVIGYNFAVTPVTFCGQNFVNQFEYPIFLASTHVFDLPQATWICGLVISVQGAELLVTGGTGCCFGLANISDGYSVKVQI